jgi:hypothetical protein
MASPAAGPLESLLQTGVNFQTPGHLKHDGQLKWGNLKDRLLISYLLLASEVSSAKFTPMPPRRRRRDAA